MKVKNISGSDQYFRFGEYGKFIKNNESVDIAVPFFRDATSNEDKALHDALYYANKENPPIEILEGTTDVTNQSGRSIPASTYAYFPFEPGGGETLTIDGTVYTFTTSATNDLDIEIAGSKVATINNIVSKLDERVKAGESNVKARASTSSGQDLVLFSAVEAGPSGNGIVVSSNALEFENASASTVLSKGFYSSVATPVYIKYGLLSDDVSSSNFAIDTGLDSINVAIITYWDQNTTPPRTMLLPTDNTPVYFDGGVITIPTAGGDLAAGAELNIVIFA